MNLEWCRFPKMHRCICSDERYERLENCPYEKSIPEQDVEDKDANSTEKEEELQFYNDDGSFQKLLVERNLATYELCQLLIVKNHVQHNGHWSLIEFWSEMGLERVMEDHEHVLAVYRDMHQFARPKNFRFIFRKDYRKYEFFSSPHQFFPPDMLEVESNQKADQDPTYLKNLVTEECVSPVIYSCVWIRDHTRSWSKNFLLLIDKNLYYTSNIHVVSKFIRASKASKFKDSKTSAEHQGLTHWCEVGAYQVYGTLNAKNQFRAPTEWGLCLRPCGVDTSDSTSPDADREPSRSSSAHELRCFACDSERVRSCWLTAMRLAKYGKQLKENYKAFKNKQAESLNHREYNSFTVPHVRVTKSTKKKDESVRSRVAMDFTGPVGRIVEDPQEARAIAVAEGYSWKKRWRPTVRMQNAAAANTHGLENGIHMLQPWFHSGMSRDQASELVNRHGSDGVFLVRESRSSPGAFVLTYKALGKIMHVPITPLIDPVRDAQVYSLDSGVTKFYDLLQLVEFYQLNAGCLPTRLTHYVVHTSDSSSGVRLAQAN
ncbi:growth factor receptor-bound protein 14 isoform X2 [Aethina tumida]|uniref:growth factor receptor-bound protein 14 isoform X2 n=1 Tax=Aethina tumida TaxID=116153 RepID=UPI00214749C2|nr:growth factor receptor-bound protein 14 isoform X2 [Aethina tumida]